MSHDPRLEERFERDLERIPLPEESRWLPGEPRTRRLPAIVAIPATMIVLVLAVAIGLELGERRDGRDTGTQVGTPASRSPIATAPTATAPTATATGPAARSPSPPPSPSPSPSPPLAPEVRVNLGDALSFVADDRAVAIVTRRGATVWELSLIDLATMQRRVVHRNDTGIWLTIGGVRGDLVTFVQPRAAGSDVTQVMVANWRGSEPPKLLDEFSPAFFGGGDSWNPAPSPKTNGTRVVWLRWPADAPSGEIVVATQDGKRSSILSTDRATFFAVDDGGRVAAARIPFGWQTGEAELLLWDGALRTVASRAADKAGPVWFVAGRALWADSFGNVRNIVSATLFDLRTGSGNAVRAPADCALSGATVRDVVFTCPNDFVRLDPLSGATSRFGTTNIASVFPHAIAHRETPTGDWLIARVP